MADETVRDDDDALCEAARHSVKRAKEGSRAESLRVLHLAGVALFNLLDRGEQPSQRDRVFLYALVESLKAIGKDNMPVENDDGEDGDNSHIVLHLKHPRHRPEDPNRPLEQQLLFVEVGREYDCLRMKGEGRADAPIRRAIQTVARKNALTTARVQDAWKALGAEDGWKAWLALEAEDAPEEK